MNTKLKRTKRQTPVSQVSILNDIIEQRNAQISALSTTVVDQGRRIEGLMTQLNNQVNTILNLQSTIKRKESEVFNLNISCNMNKKMAGDYRDLYNDSDVMRAQLSNKLNNIPNWIRKIFGA